MKAILRFSGIHIFSIFDLRFISFIRFNLLSSDISYVRRFPFSSPVIKFLPDIFTEDTEDTENTAVRIDCSEDSRTAESDCTADSDYTAESDWIADSDYTAESDYIADSDCIADSAAGAVYSVNMTDTEGMRAAEKHQNRYLFPLKD